MPLEIKTYIDQQNEDTYLVVIPSSDTSSEYFIYNRMTRETKKIDNLLHYLTSQKQSRFRFSQPTEEEWGIIQQGIVEQKEVVKQKIYIQNNKS